MVYKVIGLMSGSSLDGLDICYTHLEETRGVWQFEIIHADCIAYSKELTEQLAHAAQFVVNDYLKLNTSFGRYIGEQINQFITQHNLQHKVDFVASHGHTVFHEPEHYTSVQIGDGATIAAVTGLPVITDLRSMDVALGGQGAPIVPIGDRLLFGDYDYLLNIGGIANITIKNTERIFAFDVCPANQILNGLAQNVGKSMDENGAMAREGSVLLDVLSQLNDQAYYQQSAPKSLSNEAAVELGFPFLRESKHDNQDLLRTVVQHIAEQIAAAVEKYPHQKEEAKMMVTGGGAFNVFLIEQLQELLHDLKVKVVVPDAQVVKYKEALVMALIGALRWREETNVLSSVTGAKQDSIGGALWMGLS